MEILGERQNKKMSYSMSLRTMLKYMLYFYQVEMLLPSSTSKRDVYLEYERAVRGTGHRVVAETTFYTQWRSFTYIHASQ